MKKNSNRKAGIFNPRNLLGVFLCLSGISLAMLSFSFAATPPTGTLTDVSPSLTYTAGPFTTSNPSPITQVDSGPRCDAQFPCDFFYLTVTLPAGYHAAHPNAFVRFRQSWTDAGTGQSDYDLFVYKGHITTLDGSKQADTQSTASGPTPEVCNFSPLADGSQEFTVISTPFTSTQEIITVKIDLFPGVNGCANCSNFGGPDPTVPGNPRYQNFYAPPGSAKPVSGEFNIGFNPKTHHIFAMNRGPVWRLTPPESLSPAQPECCEALWEDKESSSVDFGLDPILWTDQKTGRTFISNSTAGANAVYGYTDSTTPALNDGDQWVPFAPSPPNFSDDHETIGSGPYPLVAGMPNPLATAANQGEAVYYCGQTFPVGSAECQRSDTLGTTFGSGVPVYNGTTSTCGGLHGHVHVAPDGTAWLPVPHCGGKQGGAFSTDSGVTWTEFTIPNTISQANGADPSIAIDSDSTIYYSYVNNEPVPAGNPLEGHARVVVGHRVGTTINWTNYFDIGLTHGIINAAEIEAVGGSSGRAAVGFLGTNVAGDYQANAFPGNWYAFIATTYDGGVTWTTVNATPNDPVQSMSGIWQQGGSAQDRNLLDFNEITVDNKGRVLYGYSDGCVSPGCIAGTAGTTPNDFVAFMRVARQFGGKPLNSQFDVTEPTLPKPACLSGTRDVNASHLTWKAPDNGGADITGYRILRGTTAGGETVIVANTGNSKTIYNDTTADPSVAHYFYVVKAINGQGTGNQSNEIDLTVGPIPPPVVPYSCSGINVVTDPAGDSINPAPGGQGPTSQGDIVGVAFSADATNLTTIMTIANLSATPLPGNTFTSYYVAWTSSNGNIYGTQADVGADPATIMYHWGPWDSANNRLASSNTTTGTFNTGANGTVQVVVPLNMIGSPTIPITDVTGIPAVRNPFGLTVAGEGAVGNGVTWLQPIDRAPDADFGNGKSWAICPSLQLSSVVSRKVHGSAGTFDIDLPLTGTRGIECRAPGQTGTPGVGYKLVFTFATPMAGCGTASTGVVGRGPNQDQCSVNLTGVPNAQYITVTLNGVVNATGAIGNVSGTMGVLIGDVNFTGGVDGNDVAAVQSHTRQSVNDTNFQYDVNATGAIDGNDVAITQGHTRTSLPSPP
jgi:hypothetical protein